MISLQLARALRDAGLSWHPVRGDNFTIDRAEADGEVYTLSDMTVEAHEFSSGTVLGFNGTTEWALDSVSLDDAVWMPREDQLRDLLGSAFRSLTRIEATESIDDISVSTAAYRIDIVVDGLPVPVEASDTADAYARALAILLASVVE